MKQVSPISRVRIASALARPLLARRRVLLVPGCLAASSPLTPGGLASAFAKDRESANDLKFGVQLNAFPIDPARLQTFMDTLGQIKEIGYRGFESGIRNVSSQFAAPQSVRRFIEETGLVFFGSHVFLPDAMYDPSTRIAPAAVYEPVAGGGAALGARHLILSGAPADSADQLKRKIGVLNAAASFAKSVGIAAAYHNHSAEFESKIGEIEALYAQTDPALSFVLDAGHVYRGGSDVSAFLRTHASRIVGIHLRDYKNGRLVSLGQGTFPLAAVAATISRSIGRDGSRTRRSARICRRAASGRSRQPAKP
ncbi:MAG: sugar phosphate isomerase/epimerase family protein [Acidobacteriaceae bacterium]